MYKSVSLATPSEYIKDMEEKRLAKEKRRKTKNAFLNLGITSLLACGFILSSTLVYYQQNNQDKTIINNIANYIFKMKNDIETQRVLGLNKTDILNNYGKYGDDAIKEMKDNKNKIPLSHILQEKQIEWLFNKIDNLNLTKQHNIKVEYTPIEKLSKENEIKTSALLKGDSCKIIFVSNKNGLPTSLAKDEKLKHLSELINDRQKEIYRQFIALHEKMHCELDTIPDSILFNFKEYNSNNIEILNNLSKKIPFTYKDIFHENFADVGATFLLHKIYDKTDPDLNFVLNVIKNGRVESYINNSEDISSHLTHFSMTDALNPHNIEKSMNIKNYEDFINFILNITHHNVEKTIINKGKEQILQNNLEHILEEVTTQVHNHYLKNTDILQISSHNQFKDNPEIEHITSLSISYLGKNYKNNYDIILNNFFIENNLYQQNNKGKNKHISEIYYNDIYNNIKTFLSTDKEFKIEFMYSFNKINNIENIPSINNIRDNMKQVREDYMIITKKDRKIN